ncbi:hypothetical protein BC938DRAFT_470597 [Jimgerdemannia flammicorona]|uniref:uridine/cytidine kinase n=1 Tax=Jimgerdemannia flammicorona TaxID=994334 RepID=A0A433Q9V1_9FUNG|nr:hypothetical protein BC938DRAFT_470597 [Jimgerdemannia flammicorona]
MIGIAGTSRVFAVNTQHCHHSLIERVFCLFNQHVSIGGSASGKTSVSERIIKNLNIPWVVIVSMDSYYKVLTPEEKVQARANNHNFDHPSAFDHDILFEALAKLKKGKSVEIPIYNFATHSRETKTKTIYGANVIIFEGIFALYDKKIMELMDLKIFVDTDADIRLARRRKFLSSCCTQDFPYTPKHTHWQCANSYTLSCSFASCYNYDCDRTVKRDISERGRDVQGVLQQYTRFVKSSFDDYIKPTLKNADVVRLLHLLVSANSPPFA